MTYTSGPPSEVAAALVILLALRVPEPLLLKRLQGHAP